MWYRWLVSILFVATLGLYFKVINEPLAGEHAHRQAATLIPAWSYCMEDSSFLLPRIFHRESTEGIAIGEFPLMSYLLAIPCKLTGSWSESVPRVLSMLIFLLAGGVWWLWLRRWSNSNQPFLWATLFFFSTLHLSHFLIPLPEAFAILLIGITALLFQRPTKLYHALGTLVFIVAFLVRPYLFPLLFLIYPNRIVLILNMGLMGLAYLVWFKYWVPLHTQISYYATQILAPKESLDQFPKSFLMLAYQALRDHMNFVLAFAFFVGARIHKKLALLWIFSGLVVIVARGYHIGAHHYYLGAMALFAVIIGYLGLLALPERQRGWWLTIYALIGVLQVQHLYRGDSRGWPMAFARAAEQAGVLPKDPVASYINADPSYFYWTKTFGWLLDEQDYRGPQACPSGAKWLLRLQDGQPVFERCL